MERGKIFGIIVVAIFAISFVFAASSIRTSDTTNLQTRSNHSDTMNVSIYTSINVTATEMNATIWYNKTGGPANGTTGTSLVTINNGSDGNIIENATVRVADLGEATTYNFSIYVDNGTDQEWIVDIHTVRIDTTAPNVSAYYNTVANGNYTDSITVNASVDDAGGIEVVFFNITNGTGQVNYTQATGSGIFYSLTVNTTLFVDGKYNITAWANDTVLNNLNNSESIQVVFDNTNPTAIPSCSNVQTGDSFPCTCAGTDATAGINSTSGSSDSPDGTATPSSTGTFTYTCTVTDYSSNSDTLTATYSVTSPPGSSSGGGSGSSSASFYSKTIPKSGNEFSSQGTITQDLKVKERMKLLINGDNHYIGVRSIVSGKVTVEVTSVPQTFDLTAGQSRKIDVDDDGTYDMFVELVSATGSSARIKTYSISETVPVDEVQDNEVSDDQEEDDEEPEAYDKSGKKVWIWVIVAVVLVVLAVLWMRRK